MTRLLAWSLGACLAGAATAQTAPLSDPTRPPNISFETAGEAAVAGPQLQSVLISPTRRAAVISGKTVALGGRFGDATVETISESAVVLRYADRRETLQLIPGLGKRERRIAAAAPSGASPREKGTAR